MEKRPETLPPLVRGVLSPKTWNDQRRTEILDLFRHEIYGLIPDERSLITTFRKADSRSSLSLMGGQAVRKIIEIEVKRHEFSFTFPLVLFIPLGVKEPVPVILTLCNRGIHEADPARRFLNSFWPAETIVAHGFAAAVLFTHDIAPDYEENFTMAFHRLYPEYVDDRPAWAWGAISAWAWGLSRAVDYLQKDPLIDGEKIALVGHSRGGKTILWCAAQDSRIAMAVSNCSGCTGAAISRRKTGERIQDIIKNYPYWFCGNYQKYREREEDLPVDQHLLLALIAPRLLYISSRTFDCWADPESEFRACIEATPAYRLYGKTGLPETVMPLPEHPILSGEIAYHIKTGNHDMDEYDWERYLEFCTKHFHSNPFPKSG
jgi:pimeloyl-ACP methyl ester carboxylesterase